MAKWLLGLGRMLPAPWPLLCRRGRSAPAAVIRAAARIRHPNEINVLFFTVSLIPAPR